MRYSVDMPDRVGDQEQAGGAPPPHQQDQVGMYSGLLQVAPNVQAADLGKYYKVSQLGYNPNDVDHIDTPHPGTVVVWDKTLDTYLDCMVA